MDYIYLTSSSPLSKPHVFFGGYLSYFVITGNFTQLVFIETVKQESKGEFSEVASSLVLGVASVSDSPRVSLEVFILCDVQSLSPK